MTLMTTKELAEMLGVSVDTIQNTVKKLAENNRQLFGEIARNTQNGYLFNQAQATAIKFDLQNRTKVASNGFGTMTITNDIEMIALQQKLMEYQNMRISELQQQVEVMKEKSICYDKFVERGDFCNLRDGAKYLGLTQNEFFDLLKTKYVYKNTKNEYRAYSEYSAYFTLRPYERGEKVGQQLMLNFDGLNYFRKILNKKEVVKCLS